MVYSANGTYIAKDIRYAYDATDAPCGIRQYTFNSAGVQTGDETYLLGTNLQGDVVAIYNADGCKIYAYGYDAWGNLLLGQEIADGGDEAAAINPFRYRGYYFDSETNLYYLNSRYYNPRWGRFLNADEYVSTGTGLLGYNMYAYCNNNPVMYADPSGKGLIGVVIVVSGFIGVCIGCLVSPSIEDVEKAKKLHYARNENNLIPNEKELLDIVEQNSDMWMAVEDKYNKYHRFTNGIQGEEAIYNKKYQTIDGKNEVIICYDDVAVPIPYIVTDPNNIGTHNYGPGITLSHFLKDVLPYWNWGNSSQDTTTRRQRMVGN